MSLAPRPPSELTSPPLFSQAFFTSAATPAVPVCNCLSEAHSFLGVLLEQHLLQTAPERKHERMADSTELGGSKAATTPHSQWTHLRKLSSPLHQDDRPYHALVCRLQLLELPLKHQAAVQDLTVVLMALTDVPTATAQLEGEGVFLFKDLR